MFLLAFWSIQNSNKTQTKKEKEKVRFIQIIVYPGDKKLSFLTRCPLYSVNFIEVFLWDFIRKTAGT